MVGGGRSQRGGVSSSHQRGLGPRHKATGCPEGFHLEPFLLRKGGRWSKDLVDYGGWWHRLSQATRLACASFVARGTRSWRWSWRQRPYPAGPCLASGVKKRGQKRQRLGAENRNKRKQTDYDCMIIINTIEMLLRFIFFTRRVHWYQTYPW